MKARPRLQKICALICACAMLLPICLPAAVRAETAEAVVRVLLTRLNLTDQLTASLDGSYTLGPLSFQRGSKIVLSCSTGRIIAYYEGMAYDLGQETALIRHAAPQGEENGLRLNGGYALYCGDLYLKAENGRLSAVLHIPVEEYLLGVVPYEMNEAFPLEALKAQAVAARTYALQKRSAGGWYDLVDNTNDQVYRGMQKEYQNAARAVAETAGVCGFYQGKLANCYYTASNGGQVELSRNVWGEDDVYITMHEDPYDVENPESVVLTARLEKASANGVIGNEAFTEAVKALVSEPLTAMGFSGESGDIRLTGVQAAQLHSPQGGAESLVMTQLRLTLAVEGRRLADTEDGEVNMFASSPENAAASPWIALETPLTLDVPVFSCVEPLLSLSINGDNNEIMTVTEEDDCFVLSARRYGHGVGMSQRGAQWMAGQYGWTYDQILRFYYPGLRFETVDTQVTLPPAVAAEYLTTPGPPATPTPRPTLMPVTQPLAEGEWRARVTQIGENSSLNLRKAPSTSAEILRVLYYGQELTVMERLPEGWLHVRTDVLEGYVMEQFVTADES